jgi:hypothetical protein
MKIFWATVLLIISLQSSFAQRTTVVRGVGTQTCEKFVAAGQGGDKQFEAQASQWILGLLTGYFRQANDDASRTMGDVVIVQTVLDVCKKNAEKTIDEAAKIAIEALPTADPKRQGEIK